MANEYYVPSNAPSTGAALSSATMRAEFQSIATALDKLPTMTGNGSKLVMINAGGTALQATTSVDGLTLTSSAFNGTVGATTPSTGAFTTLSASSTVSGAGFTARFAAPGPIGSTTPSTGAFTTLTTTGTITLDNAAYISTKNSSGTAVRMLGVSGVNAAYVGPVDSTASITSVSYAPSTVVATQDFYIGGAAKLSLSSTGAAVTGALSSTGTANFGSGSVNWTRITGGISADYTTISAEGEATTYLKYSVKGSAGLHNFSVNNSIVALFSYTGLAVTGSLSTTGAITLAGTPASAGASTRYISGGGTSGNFYTNVPTGSNQQWAVNESVVMALLSTGVAVTGALSATGQITSTVANSGGSLTPFIASHSTGTGYGWAVTGQGVDGKNWDFTAAGTTLTLRTVNDANSAAATALRITRSANTVSSVEVHASGTQRALIDSTGLAVTGDLSNTGNVTLGDASTDTVTVNGYMGVGGAGDAGIGLNVRSTQLTGTGQSGVYSQPTASSAATTSIAGYNTYIGTAAAAFTVADLYGFRFAGVNKGAGSTITNIHGLYVADQTQGTNNYGITSLVSSGTNKWNIYASGTAANYFAGNVGVGTTPSSKLDVFDANAVTLSVRSTNSTAELLLSGPIPKITFTDTSVSSSDGEIKVDANAMQFAIDGTERLRIDSSGNVGVGVTPSAWGSAYKVFEIRNVGNALWSSAANDLKLTTNVVHNGTNYTYAATAVAARYDQNNGQHIWYTAPSGTAGNAITFTQSLAVGNGTTLALEGATSAAGTGIAFPATQLASSNANTLDDYEEGTFTPTIVGTSTAGVGTYAAQFGRYTKIGNQVYFNIRFGWSAHTGTGNIQVSGLPFTVSNANTNANSFAASVYADGLVFGAGKQLSALAVSNTTVINIYAVDPAGTATSAIAMDTAVTTLIISGAYEV